MVFMNLVGGLEPWIFMTFHSVGNVIIPTDQVIFFRGVGLLVEWFNGDTSWMVVPGL
jgi:hypothetical protein